MKVIPSDGFQTTKYLKRSKKIEWEHVVPAENFGRAFSEWRDGHSDCITKKGKKFKYDLVIVNNKMSPEIPLGGDLDPLG